MGFVSESQGASPNSVPSSKCTGSWNGELSHGEKGGTTIRILSPLPHSYLQQICSSATIDAASSMFCMIISVGWCMGTYSEVMGTQIVC